VYSHPHVQPDLESPYREPVGVSLGVTECISLGVTECISHSHCYADILPHARHPVAIIHSDDRSHHVVTHALSNLSRANRGSIHALTDYQVSYHVPHDPLTNYNFAQPLPQHSIADYSFTHAIAHN
jgi:hypothetical protein